MAVLEKNSLPGRKLLISGSGRCNVTHYGDVSNFFSHYGEHSKFLRTALHSFTNLDLIDFLAQRGLAAIVDKNGKIFPQSGNSNDVLKLLLDECHLKMVQIIVDQPVLKIEKPADCFIIKTATHEYHCNKIVIATGGMSYPGTGSSGDGYYFAKEFGHSVVPPKPALSPVFIRDYKMAEIAGVSIQEKLVYLYRDNKKISEHRGDIGFTHKGLSGPGILDFSREMQSQDVLKINLVGQNSDEFRKAFIEASEKSGKMAIQTFLKKHDLPRSLVRILLAGLRIDPEQTLASINRETRNLLVDSFCECPFIIERVGGFNMAMVTKGGISLEEISSKTLESKLVPGLFFAGEVMDIDGDTGGYNLQVAFSTGYLVAESINRERR